MVRPSIVAASFVHPSDSLHSLWTAFTLAVHINALYTESIHGKEEHAT